MDRLPGRPDPIHPPRRTVWVGRAGVHSTMRVEPAGVRAILTMLTRLTTLAMLALLILDLLTTPTTLTALTILAVLTVLGPTIGSRQLSMPNPNPDPGQISMQFGFRNRTIHACPRQCALLHANFRPLKCAAACPALAAACCLRALARYPPPHTHTPTPTHPPPLCSPSRLRRCVVGVMQGNPSCTTWSAFWQRSAKQVKGILGLKGPRVCGATVKWNEFQRAVKEYFADCCVGGI